MNYFYCMKKILIWLLLFFSCAAYSQKKPLPTNCSDLQQKLAQIKKSFNNLQQFKKELLPGSTYKYATTITLCNETGELELYEDGGGAVMIFKFTGQKFTDNDGKLTAAFVAKFRKSVKAIFGNSYEETYGKDEDELWGAYEYYEYRPYSASYPFIRIDFPFADDLIWISFEYEK